MTNQLSASNSERQPKSNWCNVKHIHSQAWKNIIPRSDISHSCVQPFWINNTWNIRWILETFYLVWNYTQVGFQSGSHYVNRKHGNKKLSEESSHTNGIKAVCIFRQVMQTNLASSDCTTPTQCVAIYSIHDIKNTTTITPLH